MTKNGLYYFALIVLVLSSCVPLLPGSRLYQPADWEKELVDKSEKLVMPSDLVQDSIAYMNSLIHWVGIVDTFFVETNGSVTVRRIQFEQKYFDYIEDYSIQQEIFFVSPHGEGKFLMESSHTSVSEDSMIQSLKTHAKQGNLGFCYGVFKRVQNGVPVLEGVGLRIIESAFYSTNIMSYHIERDSLGNVVAGPEGYPRVTNIELLNFPGPGKN